MTLEIDGHEIQIQWLVHNCQGPRKPKSNGTDVEVCKTFFLQTFSVSKGRMGRALTNATVGGSPTPDERGRHEPWNKTESERIDHLKSFIEEIPQYESHYTRAHQVSRKNLAPGLTLSKLYVERCSTDFVKPVSDWKFRDVFKKEFSHFSFPQPLKDTCKTCDILAIQIQEAKQTEDQEKLVQKQREKELHLRKAEAAHQNDCVKARQGECTVFCYDLQKTLPVPVLTTGVVYYKRQMRVYNLGIHDAEKQNGLMYMWDESQASRGPNEIMSCLRKHLLKEKPKKMHYRFCRYLWRTNRNIKNALFWLHVVRTPMFDVDVVHQKFFVSGHSWMDSDKDFGVIETAKRRFPVVYVPNDWVEVVKKSKSKNPFVVTKLSQDDFKSVENLEKAIVNRKVDTDGNKVEWLKIHWLCFKREELKKIFFKYSHNEDLPFRCINLCRVRGPQNRRNMDLGSINLPNLYPEGRQIADPKLKDLKSLLQFVPPVYHGFYNNLIGNKNIADTGLLGDKDEDLNETWLTLQVLIDQLPAFN